eukprot:CAMPEP_0184678970 /NCGR_PEP_ID=MMETSP0312-20130426/1791_1 /TAXON_ID=31354 /ORGANISM="Compsopogon coeruleus, Strain SAG 36.94" /LENGTH=1237 /DNA_ID=CAMNT_0027128113 /DNA_START=458 /DNA_END=4172 /DNA_ORIENTATION=+
MGIGLSAQWVDSDVGLSNGHFAGRYDEHDGPVRGVEFHRSQPLFVSGGDDYKIKLWNYKLRRCVFTLLGHLDYIRTVSFHHESPWIVSASDDQTVRIWNWQNRQCLAVMTGHNHYVMSAAFHPAEDLVVSASLDQTIRVWDISELRTGGNRPFPSSKGPQDVLSKVKGKLPPSVNADLFGTSDAVVKYVLEGHSRGVNWATFHPTLPLIISGADDRQVKLWRMSDTKAWEVDTFRGHFNNVSSAIFHPHRELVISCSEDKTIKVWDLARRICVHTFRRENDRFWISAAHPRINLLAAGHDSGMVVFKLERERPAYSVTPNSLVYLKDNYVRTMDFHNGRDQPLMAVRSQPNASIFSGGYAGLFGEGSSSQASHSAAYQAPPRSMEYNEAEKAALLSYDGEGGSYELYVMPKSYSHGEAVIDARRGVGATPIFVGRNRFATLEKGKVIVIRDLHNEVTKRVTVSLPGADRLFPAGSGFCLVRNEERVILQDLQQKKAVGEIAAPHVKYVIWSDDNSKVALLGKHTIVLASRRLEHLATVHETIRVKSAAWDDSGVLLYTTLNHLKYSLPNGDSGSVKTLELPIYLTRVRGPAVCYLDREGNPGLMPIDPTEFSFKLLLLRKRYDDVKRMIAQKQLTGQAIIAYLHKKGFPEVALHFVQDEGTRFSLAIDSGALDIALSAAKELNDTATWRKLASEAMRQGNMEIVELCYQKTKDLENLAFLYVITGNFEKLEKMSKIAEGEGNLMARFQFSMFLGDVESRIRILSDCGQILLARLTAKTYGLNDLLEELGGDDDRIPSYDGKIFLQPTPVCYEFNWPQLPLNRGLFTRDPNSEVFEEPTANPYEDAAAFAESERDATWDDDAAKPTVPQVLDPFAVDLPDADGVEEAGAWGDEDLEIDGVEVVDTQPVDQQDEFGNERSEDVVEGGYYVAPMPGPGRLVRWTRNAALAGELAAAGAVEEAMKLLSRQIGARSFVAMKDAFGAAMIGTRSSLPGIVDMVPTLMYLSRVEDAELPAPVLSLVSIRERVRGAAQQVTVGKFSDALRNWISIISSLPLIVVDTAEEQAEIVKLLASCREYITGLKIEIEQKQAKANNNAARQVQLAGLFTTCGLAPNHIQLTLRAAMKTAYDTKNFILAGTFARKLLDTAPQPSLADAARKVIQACDSNRSNADEVDFDDRRDFVVECSTLTPLYAGQSRSSCSYCQAAYLPAVDGSLCNICGIGTVGLAVEGLRVTRKKFA